MAEVTSHAKNTIAPTYVPSKKKIAANDEEAKELSKQPDDEITDLDEAAKALLDALPEVSKFGDWRMVQESFEKDDDSNHHMMFIASVGNLRATQYGIPTADKMEAKKIVGRIIPAIATTTAMTTGLVMVELYKLVKKLPLESFRNSNVNLALNTLTQFEPAEAPKEEYPVLDGEKFTLWDTLDVEAETLQDVVDWFAEKDLEVVMISSVTGDSVMLFDGIDDEHLEKGVKEAVEEVAEITLDPTLPFIDLDVQVLKDDEECTLPMTRVYLKQ